MTLAFPIVKVNQAYNESNLIKWRALIHNFNTEVILDSGASTSIMSWSYAKLMNIPLKKCDMSIETASGDTVKAYGQTESLKIDFEGITCEIEFLVTNLKSVDILLGYNRFEKTGVLLDPKNKTFQILPGNKKVETTNKILNTIGEI